ncbi:MAG: multicopper oxidase domain-containing protein [Thiohalomonadaceae bacterium]
MHGRILIRLLTALLMALTWPAHAVIDGIQGVVQNGVRHFDLTAGINHVVTPDGGSLQIWGYGPTGGVPQYPGPTLIVNAGDTVSVTLRNTLPVNVSLIFPGQENVTATGGTTGQITREVPAGSSGVVTYTFQASRPGTFMYQSGTRMDLEVEMGLFGALIVRPGAPNQAYDHPGTAYDREYLFVLSEMDPRIHEQAAFGNINDIDTTDHNPVLWFINGRNGPDTLANAGVPWLPSQPYNSLPRMHPGETILLRLVGAGRDAHPFHTHGNHTLQIARDGHMLSSDPALGPNLAMSNFTITVAPGATYDALFTWTGAGMGWDIYGHTESDNIECVPDASGHDVTTREYCPDHEKPFPVALPDLQDLTLGGFYSGSPFLGSMTTLPPGEGGLNPNGGMVFMWHSHTERELVNFDIFPGGMMTMLMIEPHGVEIP